MTGLEPHPIFRLPTQEEARQLGPDGAARWIAKRKESMELERDDPFRHGYESPIWHVVDNLLVDGHDVKLLVPDASGILIPGPIVKGAPEILVTGSNRSSKSEWAGKKCLKVLDGTAKARGWSFADTGPISIARQQPLFWRYMPLEIRRMAAGTGKAKQGTALNISYTIKGGFTEQTFVLPNESQHWFKNYAQDIENAEGDQLNVAWLDELRNIDLLRTVRFRMGDRAGIVIVTFTSIDDAYTGSYNEYDKGSRTLMETEAELLPLKDANGQPIPGKFEKVPRVKIAGPGAQGTTRANIVYFHITDNAFYGFDFTPPKPGEPPRVTGKERFYRILRKATRNTILARAYGILAKSRTNQFPKFNTAVHVIPLERIPKVGTNYHIVDPCNGRNWFQLWLRVDPQGRKYVYRESPSYDHPGAYIPGVGILGPWALPGGVSKSGRPAYDGARGPAQQPLGWGLKRYIEDILRQETIRPGKGHHEGHEVHEGRDNQESKTSPNLRVLRVLRGENQSENQPPEREEILERWMDSRYGASPTATAEASTTLIDQLSELGMEFRAASGKDIGEGVQLINDAIDYDEDVPIGEYSPTLSRINQPGLFVADTCPNMIYSLSEWTGLDGLHGACKDPIDDLRYAMQADLDYVGEGAFEWQGVRVR